MADNVTTGYGTISTEDITTLNGGSVASQQAQRIINSIRTADGTAVDVTAVTPMPTTNNPTATGGLTTASYVSAASTNATSVKASAGRLYYVSVTNTNAAVRYIKFYNKASAPTVGTDVPVWRMAIPGAATGAGFVENISLGASLPTGIAFALTTGPLDADTGAVAAGDILVNIAYL